MFSENLRVLRKAKGLSQEELASRLHVVRQTVSKWEKGLSVPDADLLIRLSEILETPVGTLLGGAVGETRDQNEIGQQLERLNATLAERNRRGRIIWRVVSILLIVLGVFFLLLIIAFILLAYKPS